MRRLAAVLFAAAVLAGCTTNEITELTLPTTDADVTGSFNLASANGRSLPYQTTVTTTEVWTLVADKIVLQPNKTWVDTVSYTVTSRFDQSTMGRGDVTGGTYTIADGHINFTMTTGGTSTFTGAVTGNTLLVSFKGTSYIYTR